MLDLAPTARSSTVCYNVSMENNELLFNEGYESFYKMTQESGAFRRFCAEAFGEDFSQDGFSDIKQIDKILTYVPCKDDVHILDIGCGNGKMAGYLQKKTGAYIHGFDYSENAIDTAKELFKEKADFRQGLMGEITYPEESFDLITSMDSMYFAPDMNAFLLQIMGWLKKGGVFFVGYQEGDVMPKTEDAYTTVLAKALQENKIDFEVTDITRDVYDLLRKKRDTAVKYEKELEAEGNKDWFDMLMLQTDIVNEPYEVFATKMARYLYVVRK